MAAENKENFDSHRGHREHREIWLKSSLMESKRLESWEEFEEIVQKEIYKTDSLRESTGSHVDYPLFRGHSCSDWHLKSTLERTIEGHLSLNQYYQILEIAHRTVESCTGKKWDLNTETNLGSVKLQGYEFMVYLRHNGFPSPLLDWTKSPYVAAYFAFKNINLRKNDGCYASIFVYRESCGHGKNFGKPYIRHLGPNIVTDAKHYLQQSEYSICLKEQNSNVCFANHEDVEKEEGQDALCKYDIPFSEQEKVLRKLDIMNITAYSLFNSEVSLMETLSLRNIFFKRK